MFKTKLISLLGALCIASASFALQQGPIICPSIGAVQSEGMSQAAEILEGMYLTYHQSQFDTPSNWIFIMGPIMAEDEDVALSESNQYLAAMTSTAEPQEDEDGNWICEYDISGRTSSENFSVYAIQTDNVLPAFKMYQHLKQMH